MTESLSSSMLPPLRLPHPTKQTTSSSTATTTNGGSTAYCLPAWAKYDPPTHHHLRIDAADADADATLGRPLRNTTTCGGTSGGGTTTTATSTTTRNTSASKNYTAAIATIHSNDSWSRSSSLKKEEFHLRQAAYLHIARNIDRAYYKTMSSRMTMPVDYNTAHSSITKELVEFFSKFQPFLDDHDPLDTDDDFLFDHLHGKKNCTYSGGGGGSDLEGASEQEEETKQHKEEDGDCLLSKYLQEHEGVVAVGRDEGNHENIQEEDHDNIQKAYTSSYRYHHPSLLPIAMVKFHPSTTTQESHYHGLQDCVQMGCILREEMVKYQQEMQSISPPTSKKTTAAICTVSSCPGQQSNYRDHGEIVYQILCQCIAQEPNPQLYSHLLHRQRRKRVKRKRVGGGSKGEDGDDVVMVEDGGYSDRFVQYYASVTRTFHSIIVIVSNVENFSRQELEQLLRLWSGWREECGIPVGVVLLLNTVVEQQVLITLDSVFSPNVSRTWVVQEFCLGFETNAATATTTTTGTTTTSTITTTTGQHEEGQTHVSMSVLLKRFLDEFYNPKEGCGCNILMSARWMDELLEDCDQYHGSLAQCVLQLKQIFAHHFAKRGSFLALVHCKSFMDRYGINVAWFCTDSIARKFMLRSLSSNTYPHSFKLLDDIHKTNAEIHFRVFLCAFLANFGNIVVRKDISRLLIGDDFTMLGHFADQSRKYSLFLEMVYNAIRDLPLQYLMNALSQSYRVAYTSYRQSLSSGRISGWNLKHTKIPKQRNTAHSIDIDTTGDRIPCLKAKEFAQLLRTNIYLLSELQLHPQGEKTLDIMYDFRESLVEQLHSYFWEKDRREWLRLPLVPLMSCGVVENDSCISNFTHAAAIEHRTHVACAISSPICLEDDRAFDLSVVFHVMDTRIISLHCWFEQFTERIFTYTDGSATSKELFQRFAFAVYQLIFCGYVVRSRRKADAFEKSAMVWGAAS